MTKEITVAIPANVPQVRIDRVCEVLDKHNLNPSFQNGHIHFHVESDKSGDYIAQIGMLIGLTILKQY